MTCKRRCTSSRNPLVSVKKKNPWHYLQCRDFWWSIPANITIPEFQQASFNSNPYRMKSTSNLNRPPTSAFQLGCILRMCSKSELIVIIHINDIQGGNRKALPLHMDHDRVCSIVGKELQLSVCGSCPCTAKDTFLLQRLQALISE